MASAVALIPARGGSLRVPGKNVRPLVGHPLLAYTLAAARESGVFDAVVVSTDSADIAAVAERYGAEVPGLRPGELAGSTSPDIEWVQHALAALPERYEVFSLLRPTSPFRSGATIRAAYEQLVAAGADADSLRAVRPCREHPGKMWTIEGAFLRPLLTTPAGEVPMHSRQFQDLPAVHVQDSSLEVAWTRVAEAGSIAGERVLAFACPGDEGFTIDYPDDWERAEQLAAGREVALPDAGALV
ncbi:MAG: acylneuraminate cytidylyltransferase family protein [Solirubrobacteraceae bacterium]